MVDLKGQYIKIKAEVDAGIQEVINNTQFIKGPQIKVFEDNLAQYLNVKHVIACANGTDALQIAMMALNLKPGDEIILPVFTYVATAEVIALLGLTPVMIDVEPDTFCIDTNLIESKITSKTKAIVPVHLFGQCANMDEIMRIAIKYNLFVIEDTAQALGAIYNYEVGSRKYEKKENTFIHNSSFITHTYSAGTIGNIGTTSFFPSKNLGCYGDGGALFTNDDELAKKIRMICNHGQSVQYVHDVIGVNSRLDSIQAAVLNAKLPHLKSYEIARNEAAKWYDELLGNHPNIIIPKRNPQSTHVFHQYTIQIMNDEVLSINDEKYARDFIREKLKERDTPTMVYYPISLHQQNAFKSFNNSNEEFPVSDKLCHTVLSLPIHTEMTKEMVEYICKNLLENISNLICSK
ncbi:MAG: DegT/DnrJ/EryC1/StrS family aminotransferase [Bacteroidia bacterium]|nr:DegT/DnrJ/EryC1/StrS family aminotransferase [Bacteroidia bacterium]